MMFIVYKVKESDTLSEIAKACRTTTLKIRALNGVKSCRAGERLLIEVLSGTPYTVQPFDTLSKIAQRFDLTQDAIKEHNGINEVFLGQVIIVPQKEDSDK